MNSREVDFDLYIDILIFILWYEKLFKLNTVAVLIFRASKPTASE